MKKDASTAEKKPKTTKAVAKKTPSRAPIAHGVGRRKSSVARVWLKRGSGKVRVNGKAHADYFDTEIARNDAVKPFTLLP